MTDLNRRKFLAVAAVGAAGKEAAPAASQRVALFLDPAASAGPALWAVGELQRALEAKGSAVRRCDRISDAQPGEQCVAAALSAAPLVGDIAKQAGIVIPRAPEALALISGKASGRPVLLACGHDGRGLVYALLELADRVRNGEPLTVRKPVVERPANRIRSVTRLFTSDIEDKGWYNDREMWPRYLTMLAAQRFNRFNLSLGIGYDFLRNVTDGYFLFAYPFLLSVPGYGVRVPQLPDEERDRNLEMLKFIGEQTVARGMEFQLGIWMHGYEWINSPKPNYTIEGLNRDTHGPYCRDAVRALLQACPAISGVTFRIHGESGVEEGSYDFWKMVFSGVATCGRKVEIDMHAKGMDQTMLDLAVASGMPVKVSPKYWAEHLGMPYHQADIRELERPRPNARTTGLMKLSAGSRSFLRYGYGDLLREDRPWGILHRIWPGTQRLLLWGDPVTAAAHSRAFAFCGSDGVEIMEPLSFKGRRGSGIAGGRCAYLDATLQPRWDWEKYEYGHRIWGRMLYNPDTDAEVWRRYLHTEFGKGAEPMETALANGSRILPVVTTVHGASAGNNTYWPEVYLNQSMTDAARPGPYGDSPAPRVFGNVSPMDPQLFYRINDYADDLLKGELRGKYSPVEVAQWIEDYASEALKNLAQAQLQASGKQRPEYRRAAIDLELMAGLGRFFGAKFRSGVLYRIYEQTGDRGALEQCVRMYRVARDAWAELAGRAKPVYVSDITVGESPQLRGHWSDRLPPIDRDIEAIAAKLEQAKRAGDMQSRVTLAIKEALGRPRRIEANCRHVAVAKFRAGTPVNIELSVEPTPAWVRLYYRHVNHAERWQTAEMQPSGGTFRATIPADYTGSPYPLQYYFEMKQDSVVLFPGFGPHLVRQPYFVIRGT